ncbi:phosphoribosylamine--glycine ligase, partial [Candidatus Methanophagaceae archaeon]
MREEKVGILVISYGSRAAAMIDALSRSEEYKVRFYIADKQSNPFNVKHAAKHVVIPDLDIATICDFVKANKAEIDFGICGPEQPIIGGVRDVIERETGVAMICPTKSYAIEESKVAQRILLDECCADANPKFKVFPRAEYASVGDVKSAVWQFLDEIGDEVAVKPDTPAAGKGVGVWGDHFTSRALLFEHFMSVFESTDVLIEEKVIGEESSFQAFCDGKRLVPLPDTRDYKRAFDSDSGQNTGGMGSYKTEVDWLPFMNKKDRAEEEKLAQTLFRRLRGDG